MVTSCANRILHNAHTGPTPAPLLSEQWAPRFLARNPQYHIRKQQAIEANRKHAHEPDDLRHWFAKYLAICQQYNIQSGDIYNFDETGFRIGIGHD